jgi:hypothetical protein
MARKDMQPKSKWGDLVFLTLMRLSEFWTQSDTEGTQTGITQLYSKPNLDPS